MTKGHNEKAPQCDDPLVILSECEGSLHANRYDVTILVNGLPLVHIELKRRGVQLKEAFNQINRYQRDSFWAGCGLYEYVQIFVISNGTNTKYYSNTTRSNHLKEQLSSTRKGSKKTSNSFEFSSFWADSNSSTAVLQRQLENKDKNGAHHDYRIIITTIQKLSIFVQKNKKHPIFQQRVVIIFDECHRSNFGDMHLAITRNFKKYHLFGFTGTPIFAANAGTGGDYRLKTTAQAFGDKLHTYTIVDAINDENVLPFRIDYVNTIKERSGIVDKQISAIDREKAMASPQRIREIVAYILEHFDQKTKRSSYYSFRVLSNIKEVAGSKKGAEIKEEKIASRLAGFNAMFAVGSIPMAKAYYNEFKLQQAELPESQRLKIATIYSYGANEEEIDGLLAEENPESTTALDQQSRDFLEGAIKDYNQMFSTNYDTSSDKFQNYYKDLSLRMKNRQVDLLIVVNMFLTGFDATTLNTLFVDKNLKMHGLIQAFSRTNRILNSVKTFGNIVCFRDFQQETDDAIALFGDKDAHSIVLLKDFESYYNGYDTDKGKHCFGYKEIVEQITAEFPLGEQIVGEDAERRFIMLFGSLLKLINVLSTFDQFEGRQLLSVGQMQDYQSNYLDLQDKWRKKRPNAEKEVINDDLIFETELIRQVEINIDYILLLVQQYHDSNCKNKEILVDISKAIGASPLLRSKKDLIENFISQVNADTDIDKILPPMSRFGGGGNRQEKKKNVIEKLKTFFDRFFGLI